MLMLKKHHISVPLGTMGRGIYDQYLDALRRLRSLNIVNRDEM